MERSDPPQPAAAHRATEDPKRKKGKMHVKTEKSSGGRIGSERRAKNPPHIVARGEPFF